jgi:hypothetical protein
MIREPEDLPGGPALLRETRGPDAGVALDKRLLPLRIKKLGASLSPLGLKDFFLFPGADQGRSLTLPKISGLPLSQRV